MHAVVKNRGGRLWGLSPPGLVKSMISREGFRHQWVLSPPRPPWIKNQFLVYATETYFPDHSLI